jgi:hypothetical protein
VEDDLRQRLDELANRSERVLARWAFARDVRLTVRDSLVWCLAAPVVLFSAHIALILARRGPLPLPAWGWALLSLAGPIVFVAVRMTSMAAGRALDRRACLGAYDLQLDNQDRLVTADEFLARVPAAAHDASDNFRLAAIDDAAQHIARAEATTLEPKALPDWSMSRRGWASVPAAIALILAAVWVGGIATRTQNAPDAEAVLASTDLHTLPARIVATILDLRPNPARAERPEADEPAAAGNTQSTPDLSPRTPKTDQDADGQSHAGGQANSRSASQAMSSSGTPSNQQNPSQPLEHDPPQDQQSSASAKARKSDSKKSEQQASSATSGQGQSKTSSSDSSSIPATDQPDRAGANKDDGKDEEGAPEEVEEEKTAGVERPSLRRNKPPVDRNLSPRAAGDQPNPNANGRSGPGGRKKTRGVPAMILGVPTPDRIQGMTNPGRSKVTQESSTPKEEPQSALAAEQRRPRDTPFGQVDHPRLQPWMQNLIEKYFLHNKKDMR